jgi:hypothetical protein
LIAVLLNTATSGRALLAVAAAAWGFAGAAGPASAQPDPSPASSFALGVVRLVTANRYAAAWQLLPEVEKRAIPVGLYVSCERRSPVPGHLAGERVLDVRQISLAVPGRSRPMPGFAVTVQTTIAGLPRNASVTSRFDFQVVADSGRLAWVLHPDRFDAYRDGHCLHSAPPA